jgi:hypothetical protein
MPLTPGSEGAVWVALTPAPAPLGSAELPTLVGALSRGCWPLLPVASLPTAAELWGASEPAFVEVFPWPVLLPDAGFVVDVECVGFVGAASLSSVAAAPVCLPELVDDCEVDFPFSAFLPLFVCEVLGAGLRDSWAPDVLLFEAPEVAVCEPLFWLDWD